MTGAVLNSYDTAMRKATKNDLITFPGKINHGNTNQNADPQLWAGLKRSESAKNEIPTKNGMIYFLRHNDPAHRYGLAVLVVVLDLEMAVKSTKKHEISTVMGDFNAKVGKI